MKTTVKTTHSGKVTSSRMGPELIALEFTSPLNFQGVEGVYLTIDAAHVLGAGLVRLAEQAAAELEKVAA